MGLFALQSRANSKNDNPSSVLGPRRSRNAISIVIFSGPKGDLNFEANSSRSIFIDKLSEKPYFCAAIIRRPLDELGPVGGFADYTQREPWA